MISGLEKDIAPKVVDLPDSLETVLVEITGPGDDKSDDRNLYSVKGSVKDPRGILLGKLVGISLLLQPSQFKLTNVSETYHDDEKGIILSGMVKISRKPIIYVKLLYMPYGHNQGPG